MPQSYPRLTLHRHSGASRNLGTIAAIPPSVTLHHPYGANRHPGALAAILLSVDFTSSPRRKPASRACGHFIRHSGLRRNLWYSGRCRNDNNQAGNLQHLQISTSTRACCQTPLAGVRQPYYRHSRWCESWNCLLKQRGIASEKHRFLRKQERRVNLTTSTNRRRPAP